MAGQDQEPARKAPRPFIGMHFRCCNVYARIYLNKAQTAFTGHCPRCARRVSIEVAEGGSSAQFWSAE